MRWLAWALLMALLGNLLLYGWKYKGLWAEATKGLTITIIERIK